jgi:hypothetical protein
MPAPTNEIQSTTDAKGLFWLQVVMDGHALKRHGPFWDRATASDTAERLASFCKLLNKPMELRCG